MADIERVSLDIEKKIMATDEREIESKKVGEFVMDALKELDQVAYVRFASVYKQFEDFSTFQEFVKGQNIFPFSLFISKILIINLLNI